LEVHSHTVHARNTVVAQSTANQGANELVTDITRTSHEAKTHSKTRSDCLKRVHMPSNAWPLTRPGSCNPHPSLLLAVRAEMARTITFSTALRRNDKQACVRVETPKTPMEAPPTGRDQPQGHTCSVLHLQVNSLPFLRPPHLAKCLFLDLEDSVSTRVLVTGHPWHPSQVPDDANEMQTEAVSRAGSSRLVVLALWPLGFRTQFLSHFFARPQRTTHSCPRRGKPPTY